MIEIGENKRKSILSNFGVDPFEKSLDTGKLVLRDVTMKNGKKTKRWVDPSKLGTAGWGVSNKVEDTENKKTENKEQPKKSVQEHAKEASTEKLQEFIANKNNNRQLIDIATKELESRNKTEKQGNKEEKQDKENTPKEAEKELKEDDKDDVNRKFKTLNRMTKAVVDGKAKSLLVYGEGGSGKSFSVMQELEKQGKRPFKEGMDVGSDDYDYIKITGKSTAAAVYQALYDHDGKIILFDDCDSVLKDGDAVNILKGALDTSGDGTISNGSQRQLKDSYGNKIPNRFDFTGKAIFISNLESEKVPQALKSRSLRIDMAMTPQQTIDRMKEIAKDKDGGLTNIKFPGLKYTSKDMKDAIGFLEKYKNKATDLNIRTLGSILTIINSAREDNDEDWEYDAKNMILSKANTGEFKKAFDILN